MKLDHILWGNGHGLKTPHCDGIFYWLNGQFYVWSGWFGCQLASFQWTHPIAGERRQLAGYEFIVFHSERQGPRVKVSWVMTGLAKLSLDDANIKIHQLKKDLKSI